MLVITPIDPLTRPSPNPETPRAPARSTTAHLVSPAARRDTRIAWQTRRRDLPDGHGKRLGLSLLVSAMTMTSSPPPQVGAAISRRTVCMRRIARRFESVGRSVDRSAVGLQVGRSVVDIGRSVSSRSSASAVGCGRRLVNRSVNRSIARHSRSVVGRWVCRRSSIRRTPC